MTTTHIRSPSPVLSLSAACVVLVVALQGPLGTAASAAHADPADVDAKFLAALTSRGITFTSPEVGIAAGHVACDKLDGGETPTQVAQDVMNSSSLDGYHAGYFVGASIGAYCPQYAGKT
jgi:Protein of unknown function (DUF732)